LQAWQFLEGRALQAQKAASVEEKRNRRGKREVWEMVPTPFVEKLIRKSGKEEKNEHR